MKNEDVQKWALLAEIVGGIAVVISLIFLALQMRENTNALQAQTFQDLMQDLNEYRSLINQSDVSIIRELRRTEGLESLSVPDQRRIRGYSLILWGIYESAFFANNRGVLGRQEWSRFQSAICRNRIVDNDLWTAGSLTPMDELLTSDFVAHIDQNC